MPFNPAAILANPHSVAHRLFRHTARVRRAVLVQDRGPFWAIRANMLSPIRAVRDTVRILEQRATENAVARTTSRARQIATACWLHTRHGYDVDASLRFELTAWRDMHPIPLFLPETDLALIARTIIPSNAADLARTIADKRRFAEWAALNDIPSPAILLHFENGRVIDGSVDDPRLRQDLFAKWATSHGGADTQSWTYTQGRYVDTMETRYSLDQLIERLAAQSTRAPVILQPRLRNHPDLEPITRRALTTVRIVTVRRPGTASTALFGLMRIATGNSPADNLSQGGLATVVDYRTGTLGDGFALVGDFSLERRPVHPDTGAAFRDVTVPCWREAVDLALEAHDTLGDIPCVGWDLGITDDGPVVVEGNWLPGMTIVQRITRVPILSTDYAVAFAAYLEPDRYQHDDRWLADHESWNPIRPR